MSNDLATLSSKLATALRDTTHETWTQPELEDLVTWAVAGLYPRYARVLDPTTATLSLVAGTYFYALPAGVVEVSAVDYYSGTSEYGPLDDQSWAVAGDLEAGTGQLHVVPIFAESANTLRLYGYGKYDVTTNLIPDVLVPLVIARARAEAYRRMGADRAQFVQWQARSQKQNVSVNELIMLINEADADANQLESRTSRTWRRPVPGRLG